MATNIKEDAKRPDWKRGFQSIGEKDHSGLENSKERYIAG
jgi:hypothetical protein